MSVLGLRRCVATVAATAVGLAIATTATAAGVVGVDPAEVSYDARPGDSIAVTTTVTTPELPPTPDVVLLVDRTGSMGNAIDNVKANIAEVIATVKASQPDAQFAVAQYCDSVRWLRRSRSQQDLTGRTPTPSSRRSTVATLCDGGDWHEAQLNALWEIGNGGHQLPSRILANRRVVRRRPRPRPERRPHRGRRHRPPRAGRGARSSP